MIRATRISIAVAALGGLVASLSLASAQIIDPAHPPLGSEGIYDPGNPGIEFLQEPAIALRDLPRSAVGNHVDWVTALEGGFIEPRMSLDANQIMRPVNMDVQMDQTGSMPFVSFPHYAHTLHLACSNCHTKLFLPRRNANPVNMFAILQGEYCGVCHGKVAFPLTDCFRCHNTPKDSRMLPR